MRMVHVTWWDFVVMLLRSAVGVLRRRLWLVLGVLGGLATWAWLQY